MMFVRLSIHLQPVRRFLNHFRSIDTAYIGSNRKSRWLIHLMIAVRRACIATSM